VIYRLVEPDSTMRPVRCGTRTGRVRNQRGTVVLDCHAPVVPALLPLGLCLTPPADQVSFAIMHTSAILPAPDRADRGQARDGRTDFFEISGG